MKGKKTAIGINKETNESIQTYKKPKSKGVVVVDRRDENYITLKVKLCAAFSQSTPLPEEESSQH